MNTLIKTFVFLLILFFSSIFRIVAQPWSSETYPDEAGFRQRITGMVQKITARDFGKRSLAFSKCPDTGLPVYTWAVQGEEIISPYTGRRYKQGDTGYFGPKQRNYEGQIVAFGGDPLKYDLPPATACLLLNQRVDEAKAFLSIPGNLNQQYHFACKNWARFYPLLANQMGEAWKKEFMKAVSAYSENRRPSDGEREMLKLGSPHNLVGQPGFLLGGNPIDGGTENHKTMWRTSSLLYSQLLPDTAKISGYPVKEAEKLTKEMLRDYLKKLLITGNGEYDSQVYYPHSIEGFLNLYDFSPDEETRLLAKFALDYYFVTYGLKVIDGTIAGAQKRGYLAGKEPCEMENMLWAFFNHTSSPMRNAEVTIQQATTTYRPNNVICNIVNKNLQTPFEARMSRPFYHMDHPDAFAETFYCSESYAIGNIQMTIVDNPNQQMVWSVIAKGTDGPICFSGGHPMRGSTSGHSPYTQTFQSKGTLILLTASTGNVANIDTSPPETPPGTVRANLWLLSEADQGKSFEIKNRAKYASKPLHVVKLPQNESVSEIIRFWNESKNSASSWFYFPGKLRPKVIDNRYFFEGGNMLIAVIPLNQNGIVIAPVPTASWENSEAGKFLSEYSLIVFPGEVSGYIVETAEKQMFGSIESFSRYLKANCSLHFDLQKLKVEYNSGYHENLVMKYNPSGLRCRAELNGKHIDWDNFTKGSVYDSPFLKSGNGIMVVSDGKESYRVDFRNNNPVYSILHSNKN